MLVLSRERGQRVHVIDDLTGRLLGVVLVVDIRGSKCCLGFEFGDEVKLLRSEISDVLEPDESLVLAVTP